MTKAAWRSAFPLRRRHAQRSHVPADLCRRFLEALGAELRALGIESEVITSGARPWLRLGSRPGRWSADSGFEDHVLAAPAPGVGWSYWRPTIDLIGPVADPARAAEIIANDLGVDTPVPGSGAHEGAASMTCRRLRRQTGDPAKTAEIIADELGVEVTAHERQAS